MHYKLGKAGRYRRVNVYCNPRYRGLGPGRTPPPAMPGVDGYLYLNRPGVSGAGTCNGGFKAGEWWPERALMYSTYATEQLGPAPRARASAALPRLALQAGRAHQGREHLQLGVAREALQALAAGADGGASADGRVA